jgi:hypothetical protein
MIFFTFPIVHMGREREMIFKRERKRRITWLRCRAEVGKVPEVKSLDKSKDLYITQRLPSGEVTALRRMACDVLTESASGIGAPILTKGVTNKTEAYLSLNKVEIAFLASLAEWSLNLGLDLSLLK